MAKPVRRWKENGTGFRFKQKVYVARAEEQEGLRETMITARRFAGSRVQLWGERHLLNPRVRREEFFRQAAEEDAGVYGRRDAGGVRQSLNRRFVKQGVPGAGWNIAV